MINPEILREYDIRGIYQKSLKLRDIESIAKKISNIILETREPHNSLFRKIIIGHDGRLSSLEIKNKLIDTFRTHGINVIDISLIPTPLSYWASKILTIPNLIMITGSHNPKEYNGLKIIINNKPFFGEKIKSLNVVSDAPLNKKLGRLEFKDVINSYELEIIGQFKNINNLKIVWDPGNGAIAPIIHKIINLIKGTNVILNRSIDGNFPNHHPDPTVKKNITQISEYIKKNSFDLGIAFDGDGDRVGIIDNRGNLVYSDIIFLLLVLDLQVEKKELTAIADVKCSKILFDTLKDKGVNILMSKTGHSLIKEMIIKENADIAGEMSGHIFYKHKYYGYDDAIYASLKLIKLINKKNMTLSNLIKPYIKSISTPEIKLYCKESSKFLLLKDIIDKLTYLYDSAEKIKIDGLRIETIDFWFLIRASNTQNCLVFRLEHYNRNNFQIELNRLISIFEEFDIDISELTTFNNTI